MLRRTLATVLWAYFGWYAAALALTFMGLPTTVAPAGAVVAAGIALVDWRAMARRPTASPATDAISDHRAT